MKEPSEDRWTRWDRRIRDLVLWAIGIYALWNELFQEPEIRPLAIPIIAGVLGFPFAALADERRRGGKK